MNTLKGLLHLNRDGIISAGEFTNHSAKMSDAVENVITLQTNLLRWSKLQLEGFQPVNTKIDCGQLVSQVIRSLSFSAKEKNVTIQNSVPSIELHADEEVLKMILRNFLSNAIKFSIPEGTIRVIGLREDSVLTLSVQDEGAGMTNEQINEIFTLNKITSVGTKNEKGAGIGLVITNDFAEMIGGKISVLSVLGKGSVFSVSFPMK
jgi:two-component system, sensor histidine kinase and response regulator